MKTVIITIMILIANLFAASRPDIASFNLKIVEVDKSIYAPPYTFLESKIDTVITESDTIAVQFEQYYEGGTYPPYEQWLNIANGLPMDSVFIVDIPNDPLTGGSWEGDVTFTTNGQVVQSIDLYSGYWEMKVEAVGNPEYYSGELHSGYSPDSYFFKIASALIEGPPRKFKVYFIIN